jgi:phosphoribosylglycinamide formyltransferase 2
MAARFEVINMPDGSLDRIVAKHKPDFIVPGWSYSYWTFYDYEKQGITVVLSQSGKFHDEPKAIRDLASGGIKTADTAMQLLQPNCDKESKGMPCVVKPPWAHLKRTVHYHRRRHWASMAICWWRFVVKLSEALSNSPDHFINCCPKHPTLFCTIRPPTRTGDYQSWQPAKILDKDLKTKKRHGWKSSLRWCRTLGVEFSLLMMAFIFRTLPRMIPEW